LFSQKEKRKRKILVLIPHTDEIENVVIGLVFQNEKNWFDFSTSFKNYTWS
jgi:hypothetical protein